MPNEDPAGAALLAVEALVFSLRQDGVLDDIKVLAFINTLQAKADAADKVDPSTRQRGPLLRIMAANIRTQLLD